MREMSVAEQRYKAVMAVISEGRTITQVARDWGVSRQTMHAWLARYEADGLEGLANLSHRPAHCPHQMAAAVEVELLEMRRAKPYWGERRLALELRRKREQPAPSKSAIYRALVRAGVIDPLPRRRRSEKWKRWERGVPMELWQLDVVHGFLLADGTSAKALTGVDDHSRYCVSARLMARERTQSVCDGFTSALRSYGVPQQVLTDNGKVFTGRYAQPPVEVLFDRICRENGVDHILTQPASPTTTGKIERFHRTLRIEFNTRQVFRNLKTAQEALEEWVCRRVASNGIVSVGYQQVSVGKHFGGSACDVLVTDGLLQFWVGSELLKTVVRTSKGNVRKLHADGTAPRRR